MKTKTVTLYGTEFEGNYVNVSVTITEMGTTYVPAFRFLYKQDIKRRLDKLSAQRLARDPSDRKTPVRLKSPTLRATIHSRKSATSPTKNQKKQTLKVGIRNFFKRRTKQ